MNITIRFVEEEDASFIVKLRNNTKSCRYLNKTSPSIENQIEWIRSYKSREKSGKEFYFIILENGLKKGLYRLYNIDLFSFTIGSWLFESCENKQLPILTDLLMADIGFRVLKKNTLYFDVRKDNINVINYHSLKEVFFISEDELNNYYQIKVEDWETSKINVLNFFGIEVSYYNKYFLESKLPTINL